MAFPDLFALGNRVCVLLSMVLLQKPYISLSSNSFPIFLLNRILDKSGPVVVAKNQWTLVSC